jgi:dynein heavy chain
LNYIIAEVNYGGRVTDYKDIKLISALLRRYLCPEVMNDNYKLSKLDTYYAPPDGTYTDTVNYIDQLPADEDPEVFGLHPNDNIAYELMTVYNCVDTILSLQPRVASSGAEKSPE